MKLARPVFSATFALALVAASPVSVFAEGTAQLGENQDVDENTQFSVDIIAPGEVINITLGNNSMTELDPLIVTVRDPNGAEVTGSPFTVGPGSPGWFPMPNIVPTAAMITNPLRVVAPIAGTYAIRINNMRAEGLIDPLDITVTPNAATAVDPANPTGGFGRLHTREWRINAGSFSMDAATNASFYVLTPTGMNRDATWELRFEGLAGFIFEVAGNDVGLPAPNSGFSEDEQLSGRPAQVYEVYLNVPQVAQGGSTTPVISNFGFMGPAAPCRCAIAGLSSVFGFESDSDGTFQIIIDTNMDSVFDPGTGDVLIAGAAMSGMNMVQWDGNDNAGQPVPMGTYAAQLSVRLGEFHFVGRDIETSRPGLRMFLVDPPVPSTTPQSTNMFWNDSRINTTLSPSHQNTPGGVIPTIQRSMPTSTFPDGLSSGDPAGPTTCGVNSHCWGNFQTDRDPESPGNYRYIDTYVFFSNATTTSTLCTQQGDLDPDMDGLTTREECSDNMPSDPNNSDTDGDRLPDGAEDRAGTDPTNPDTDMDGIPDGTEDANQDGVRDPTETSPTLADSDMDGLNDGEEDTNRDGMHDPNETNPRESDTDMDGLPDGIERGRNADGTEIMNANMTNPIDADSDDDGLPDGIEDRNMNGVVDMGETNPNDDDSDGDGIPDGTEDANGNGIVDMGETDPADPDTDDDGLNDGQEDTNMNGNVDPGESDPRNSDTDEDDIPDGIERGVLPDGTPIANANMTDPTNTDTDMDGLPDGNEDRDRNGVQDDGETDPNDADTDNDDLPDGIERGFGPDGSPLPQGSNTTDALNPDTDGDGLPDGLEDANQNGMTEESETNPEDADTDNDGLCDGLLPADAPDTIDCMEGEDRNMNGQLDLNETDPTKLDTDGGGEADGSEVLLTNHDPRDPADDRADFLALQGGGGCECVTPRTSSIWPLLLLLVAFVFRNRRRATALARSSASRSARKAGARRADLKLPFVLSAALLATSATDAAAQTTGIQFPVNHFQPGPSRLSFWVTENGKLTEHLSPSVALLGNFSSRPLQLVNLNTNDRQADLIKNRINMNLMVAVGFWDRLELGLDLPITVSQTSGNLAIIDRPGQGLSGGFGDLRIVPKVRVGTAGATSFTLSLPFSVPTGNKEAFLGNDGLTFTPTAILSFDTKYFDLAFNAGFRLRKDQALQFTRNQGQVNIGNEVIGSAGMKIALWREKLDLVADVFAAASIKEQDVEEIPVEALGGFHMYFPHGVRGYVGGGGGITRGIGAPQFRIIAGVGYQFEEDPDPDSDGLVGDKDKCPLKPEDFDNFEDTDGCPDEDNDKDGILDIGDKCPLDAEDKDDFADQDGCPDTDNDEDGILDVDDKCPKRAEDKDGYDDTDGCPENDNDQDGIADADDKCPNEPEDKDGIEDSDGCPDGDNDADGIADEVDQCPKEPEDKDNFQDADGCPDPDNDGDGVLDKADKCPNDAEDADQFEDTDGCPEADNDKDGILDAQDQCPVQPEDKDNFEDTDGCPDTDNDKDGILDAQDKCPLEPETINNVDDDDGCPDKSKGPIQIDHGKITAPPVYFATGKDRILAQSFPILKLVALTFKDNPWIKKVRIEGHTDSRGSARRNRKLSDRRARSVMRFLIDNGVDPARLDYKGFGEDVPIASNKTKQGRAENRRVEFVIVDPPTKNEANE